MCAPLGWSVTTAWSFQHSFPWHAKYFPNSHPVVSRSCVRLHATCKTKAVTMWRYRTLSYSILLAVNNPQVTHPEYTGKWSKLRRVMFLLWCVCQGGGEVASLWCTNLQVWAAAWRAGPALLGSSLSLRTTTAALSVNLWWGHRCGTTVLLVWPQQDQCSCVV